MSIARFLRPLLAAVVLVSAHGAQTVKLNDPLVQPIAGDVQGLATAPSGERVVYLADQEEVGLLQLYGVPLDGSEPPVRLSPGTSAVARSYFISPDGARVAFLVGAALYVAPTDGSSAALALTGPIPIEDTGNFRLAWSPDSAWIAYRETLTGVVLSAVPADGSEPPTDLSVSGTIAAFEISGDSKYVVFLGGGNLKSVAIDGSTLVVELDPPGPGDVFHFEIAPDGETVAFVADHGGPRELWAAPTDGTAPAVKVSGTMVGGGAVSTLPWDLEVAADSARVAFLADRAVDERFELWVAPLDGSAPPLALSGALTAGRDVTGFQLTPDGREALVLGDLETDGLVELWLARLDGQHPPVKLNGPVTGDVSQVVVSPDSQHAAFRAPQSAGVTELFSAPIGKLRRSGPRRAVRLNEPLEPGTGVGTIRRSIPGRYVLYAAALAGRGTGMWGVPFRGGASIDLTPEALPGGHVGPTLEASGERGVLLADLDGLSGTELFGLPLDGSTPSARLSDPLPPGPVQGDVRAFAVTPAGDVLYLADQELDERFELYRAPHDGSAPPVKLSAPLVLGGSVGGYASPPPPDSFALSSDGGRFVYVADQETPNQVELFGGPVDGSTPPVRLNAPFAPVVGGVQAGPRFSAEGSRVVYRAYLDGSGKTELFSVPSDGSAAPLTLNQALPTGGDVEPDFALSLDGTRAVWRADEATNDKVELWSAPLDGSAARVRLSGGLASTRDVLDLAVVPTGQRVLYRADAALDDVFELHSVPIAGGTAPLRLHPALPAGRNVTHYLAAPDGSRVIYLADADADERFELFAVPVDGSAAPVKLNGTLAAGGDVGRYLRIGCAISPDGTRVAYVADQDVDERFELYVAPLDGSAPAVKVSGTMVPGGDVGTDDVTPSAVGNYLEVTPDSRHVLFLADRETDGVNELWLARLDASAPPRRLNALLGSRTIDSFALDRHGFRALYRTHELAVLHRRELFAVPLDGSHPAEPLTAGPSAVGAYAPGPEPTRALFLADQDSEGVTELFSTRLRRGPRRSR